jgi:superfamily II DNA or RNA helicase
MSQPTPSANCGLISLKTAPALVVRETLHQWFKKGELETLISGRASFTFDLNEVWNEPLQRNSIHGTVQSDKRKKNLLTIVIDQAPRTMKFDIRGGCECGVRGCRHVKTAAVQYLLKSRPDVENLLVPRNESLFDCHSETSNAPQVAQKNVPAENREPTPAPPSIRLKSSAHIVGATGSENKIETKPTVRARMSRDASDLLRYFSEQVVPRKAEVKVQDPYQSSRMNGRFVLSPTYEYIFLEVDSRFGSRYEPEKLTVMDVLSPTTSNVHGQSRRRVDLRTEDLCKQILLKGHPINRDRIDLGGTATEDLLSMFADSGSLFAADRSTWTRTNLLMGPPLKIQAQWQAAGKGKWQFVVEGAQRVHVIPGSPDWYIDLASGCVGRFAEWQGAHLLRLKDRDIRITDGDLALLEAKLAEQGLASHIPPLPKLEIIDGGYVRCGAAVKLNTTYQDGGPIRQYGYTVGYEESTKEVSLELETSYKMSGLGEFGPDTFVKYAGNKRIVYKKDLQHEKTVREQFDKASGALKKSGNTIQVASGPRNHSSVRDATFDFQRKHLGRFKDAGLDVKFSSNFEWELVQDDGWKVQLTEADKRWYSASVLVMVNGKPIDITSVVKNVIRDPDFTNWMNRNDGTPWPVCMQDGSWVDVPAERIKRLVSGLIDLDPSTDTSGPIRISRMDVRAAQVLSEDRELVITGAEKLQSLADMLNTVNDAPWPALEEHLKLPPRSYQWFALNWLHQRWKHGYGGILGDEMAAGKTYEVLLLIYATKDLAAAAGRPSLVVLTKTLMDDNKWEREAGKFFKNLQVGQYRGGRIDADWLAEQDVVLISYDTLWRHLSTIEDLQWNVVAADEGHRLRNMNTKASKAFYELNAIQKLVVTGTDIQNKTLDRFTLLDMTVPGLLRDKTWFTNRFIKGLRLDGVGAIDSYSETRLKMLGMLTAPFVLQRTNKEIRNQLPQVNRVNEYVAMGEVQRDIYEGIRISMNKEILELVAQKGLARSKVEVLSKITKLRQACSDARLVSSVQDGDTSAKLERLSEMVVELSEQGKKVVISSQWLDMLDSVQAMLNEHKLKNVMLTSRQNSNRSEALNEFRTGNSNFLLMTMGVGGEGIDLPEADVFIVFEPWWNPFVIDQALARLTRDDRNKQITAFFLLTTETLEDGVCKIAEKKRTMAAAIRGGQHVSDDMDMTMDDILELLNAGRKGDSGPRTAWYE